jgi:hypothetical protein
MNDFIFYIYKLVFPSNGVDVPVLVGLDLDQVLDGEKENSDTLKVQVSGYIMSKRLL